MEQARQRRRRQAALLAEHPHCIYCGGVRKATTIDHMPPRIMFRSKLRPGQLEFPSCDPCNQLTKASDQVAALVGRFLPDAVTPEEKADFRKILTGLKNNMRPVLEEMNLRTAEEEQVRRRTTAYAGVPGGFIYLGGPLMQGYLNAFGCKLALAMHWEATKLIVPVQGGVALRVYSNVDAIEGKLPRPLLNLLPPELHTLKQGRWNVRDQFEYSMGITRNHRMGVFFARFRSSFAVTAVTAFDRAVYCRRLGTCFRLLNYGALDREKNGAKPDVESASSHSRALSGRGGVRDG